MSIEGMSREQRRMMRRMGAVNEHGAPTRAPRQAPQPKAEDQRTSPVQFLREVRGEMRKVAKPTREEVKSYSIIVLVTVVLFTAVIFGLDYASGKLMLGLFNK
jgi:preprotein translocase subunit SecE